MAEVWLRGAAGPTGLAPGDEGSAGQVEARCWQLARSIHGSGTATELRDRPLRMFGVHEERLDLVFGDLLRRSSVGFENRPREVSELALQTSGGVAGLYRGCKRDGRRQKAIRWTKAGLSPVQEKN